MNRASPRYARAKRGEDALVAISAHILPLARVPPAIDARVAPNAIAPQSLVAASATLLLGIM